MTTFVKRVCIVQYVRNIYEIVFNCDNISVKEMETAEKFAQREKEENNVEITTKLELWVRIFNEDLSEELTVLKIDEVTVWSFVVTLMEY